MPQNNKPDPKKRPLSSYIFSTLLIFAVIVVLYSLLSGVGGDKTPTISLSEVARLAEAGQVKAIVVNDQDLTVTKSDGTVVDSKDESNASLVQTLAAYGVDPTHLDALDITVASQSGFMYLLETLFLPVILPIALVLFFFWMLTRQGQRGRYAGIHLRAIKSPHHRSQ